MKKLILKGQGKEKFQNTSLPHCMSHMALTRVVNRVVSWKYLCVIDFNIGSKAYNLWIAQKALLSYP